MVQILFLALGWNCSYGKKGGCGLPGADNFKLEQERANVKKESVPERRRRIDRYRIEQPDQLRGRHFGQEALAPGVYKDARQLCDGPLHIDRKPFSA